jgi:hypothetical protein
LGALGAFDEALALYQWGALHAHAGSRELEQAEGACREGLTLAHAFGMRPLQAHCHLGLGTVYATTGRREQARPELSSAIELYNTMDMTFWLPQAETVLAQVEGR